MPEGNIQDDSYRTQGRPCGNLQTTGIENNQTPINPAQTIIKNSRLYRLAKNGGYYPDRRKRVILTCLTCGASFERTPSDVKERNYCSAHCQAISSYKRKCSSDWHKSYWSIPHPERAKKISTSLKEGFSSGRIPILRHKHTELAKQRMSIIQKRRFEYPDERRKTAEATKKAMHRPEVRTKYLDGLKRRRIPENTEKIRREKISKTETQQWSEMTSEQRNKRIRAVMSGCSLKEMNRFEKETLRILNARYPANWTYSGDKSVVINGKVPDFININGQKKAILCNGIYWHLWRRYGKGFTFAELKAVKRFIEYKERKPYESVGFKVFFIWEDELLFERKKILSNLDFFARGNQNPQKSRFRPTVL